jgi:hypothetical protein
MGNNDDQPKHRQQNTNRNDNNGTWYFYNPMIVSQGKTEFQRRWGNRKNEDNWRFSAKPKSSTGGTEGTEQTDSLGTASDSLGTDSISDEEQALGRLSCQRSAPPRILPQADSFHR